MHALQQQPGMFVPLCLLCLHATPPILKLVCAIRSVCISFGGCKIDGSLTHTSPYRLDDISHSIYLNYSGLKADGANDDIEKMQSRTENLNVA